MFCDLSNKLSSKGLSKFRERIFVFDKELFVDVKDENVIRKLSNTDMIFPNFSRHPYKERKRRLKTVNQAWCKKVYEHKTPRHWLEQTDQGLHNNSIILNTI